MQPLLNTRLRDARCIPSSGQWVKKFSYSPIGGLMLKVTRGAEGIW
jgi:hypothetical protein